MRKITIREPIWHDLKIGIADAKITDDLEIEIEYTDKHQKRVFANRYFITQGKAKGYPLFQAKGTPLRIIPIKDLEVIEDACLDY